MIFSQHISFGAFAMLFLQRCKECRTLTLESVGAEMGLSKTQSRKVLDALASSGLIVRAGRPTLYRLVRPLNEVHMGQLLDALEPPPAPVACQQNPNRLCQTFQELWGLYERVRTSIRGVTISTFVRAMRAASTAESGDATLGRALPQLAHGFVADGESAWVPDAPRVCCDPISAEIANEAASPVRSHALPVLFPEVFAAAEVSEALVVSAG